MAVKEGVLWPIGVVVCVLVVMQIQLFVSMGKMVTYYAVVPLSYSNQLPLPRL